MQRQQAIVHMNKLVGENIQAERKIRGLTVADLAEIMSLTVADITELEDGKQGVDALDLNILATAFDVPVDRFCVYRPDNGPYTMAAGDDNEPNHASRDTVYSLAAGLTGKELDFLVLTIRSLLRGDMLCEL